MSILIKIIICTERNVQPLPSERKMKLLANTAQDVTQEN